MNETVNLWKLFFCCTVLGFPDPRAQTGSNETLRQTKYCQTERHSYEYVFVKKQNRYHSQQVITYFLLVTEKI